MTVQIASAAERAVEPRATVLVTARFFGASGFAKARRPLISAPSAGRSGMAIRIQGLTIQLPRLVDVDRAAQPVERDDDGQPDGRLPRRDGDDEDGEDLPLQRAEARGEGDE